MKNLLRIAALSLFSLPATWTGAYAAGVLTQTPCQSGTSNACYTMTSATPSTFILRTLSLSMQTAGTAFLHFQGSMLCSNTSSQPRVVDIVTQVVNDPYAVPLINGIGGARHAAVIINSSIGTTTAFNLSTVRQAPFSVGTTRYYFLVRKLRVDPDVRCIFYNDTFSLVTTP